MSRTAPNPRGAQQKDPKEVKTQILSVRLPSVELRREFAAKLQADGLTVASWMATIVSAYVDGRLKVQQKVEPERPPPSFLIPADQDSTETPAPGDSTPLT
ncbi:hypothetical protein U5801_11815 [Lamprobacter modestohalophilus]|uniref:hypothetical protein n=1 Tax=Lamprobacter modestohalophilus TaxID=1064514 RepID=UPI002ADEF2CB|nr:hypothetical protein [Lamprobacter modestohalophilus]MEA1050491.1 hypothetical protein [Lamprobacter modestohalophilus]